MIRPFLMFLLSWVLFNCTRASVGDSITINGKVTPDSGTAMASLTTAVHLIPYKPGGEVLSTPVSMDGTFRFRLQLQETTLYELKYKGYRLNLVLSPTETSCTVLITANEKDARYMTTKDSRENEAYNKYFRKGNNAFKREVKDIIKDCAADAKTCGVKLKTSASMQNMKMEYIRDKYPATFAATLAHMAEVPQIGTATSALTEMRQHFFDDADLKDLKLYGSPDLTDKISLYLDCFADTSSAARLKFITAILTKSPKGSEAQKQLISLLLSSFMDEDREDYLQSLVVWANTHADLKEEQPVMAAKIALLANVINGGLAPEVSGTDTSEAPKTLSAAIAYNKLTLLIFWESDCPHCRKAMPEFIKLYQKYHTAGFGIFAASMDTEEEKWKQFIVANHLSWDNILLPPNTSAHADYFIQFTPTVVLIDKNGRIIHRFIEVSDLNQSISEILGK